MNAMVPAKMIVRLWCLKLVLAALLTAGLLTGQGCPLAKEAGDNYLIKVGESKITVAEFKHAVATASEEAFSGERNIPQEVLNDLRMRVLNQLSEELVIVERAKVLGLSITEAELEAAVSAIKADYPDNTFEETLLENAVSYEAWKQKLATRLLVEKVISKELVDQVQITPDDVAVYYQEHYPRGMDEDQSDQDINKRIVKHLRQQKAEQGYKEWIEHLRKAHPVEINREQWNRMIGKAKK